MKKPPMPSNEKERLNALKQYNILDTLAEDHLDEITKLASLITDCPISLISLIDENRQWFKSKQGLSACETSRDISYCGHAILGDDIFIVEDSALDERFSDNPLVLNTPYVRFYAGVPLTTASGYKIGTLCVIDSKSKKLDEKQKMLLKNLAKQIINYLDLKQKTEQLIKSEEKRELIFNNMIEGLIVQNQEGKIIEYNPSTLKILELTESQLLGIESFIPKLDIKEDGSKVLDQEHPSVVTLKTGKSVENVVMGIVESNEKIKWLKVNSVPLQTSEGINALTTFKDITEAKKAQEDYMQQKAISQHRSKLAAIGELAAGVGHEINNPLAIIKGFVDNIERKLEGNLLTNADLKSYTGKINLAIERISKIVQGLRTFSRSDNDEIDNFSPTQVLQESIGMIKEIYEKENVKIYLDLDNTNKLTIFGNRGRFQQVLINLMSNAKDALASQTNKEIKISLFKQDNEIVMKVADNGCGIPLSLQKKIFEPFFTTKEVNKGTGIGLALVNSFVKEMKGTLSVESQEQKGTSFIITIPQSDSEQVDKNKQEVVLGQYNGSILLVDDEPDLREILEELLSEKGFKVTTASDGLEAYELYCKKPSKFDLIITDMQMPKMNGIDLINALRKNNQIKQPEIAVITGGINLDFQDQNNDIVKKITGCIYKPFDDKNLKEVLDKSFKNN